MEARGSQDARRTSVTRGSALRGTCRQGTKLDYETQTFSSRRTELLREVAGSSHLNPVDPLGLAFIKAREKAQRQTSQLWK